jgi:uncharacterized protein (UPF0332 family)
MNKEFQDCLKKKNIREFPQAKGFVSKELRQAEADCLSAVDSLERGNYKWSTIQSYYSMFHSARALLYSKGYRERSHYCVIIAMRALYVEKGLLSLRLVEAMHLAKTLRENADYYGDFTKEAAAQLIEDAQKFLEEARKLLSELASD